MKITKISATILIILLTITYGSLLAQKTNLITADLGRHLKNGELFLQNFSVPQGNLYSYTYPTYHFINHHWSSGVVFYLIYELTGFIGLSTFFIFISLLTFFIFFNIAIKYSNLAIVAIISIFIIPVLASRVEIRPEIFSYLFSGVFFWILWNYNQEKINHYWLLMLPVIEIIWVNFHIYFFLGPALIGAFLIGELIDYAMVKNKKTISKLKWFFVTIIASGFTTLINPAGINGVLYPLKIFKNYGYRIFENQSVWFIEKLMSYPPALYFKIIFGILAISWIIAIFMAVKKRTEFSVANFIITLAFSAAGFWAIRNFTIFGYFALPIAAINFKFIVKKELNSSGTNEYFTTTVLAAIIMIILIIINQDYWRSRDSIGLGLKPEINAAAEFFKEQRIVGPIFNNYDIGGYLIYYLYPMEKVFVDNRPEAYPDSFFTETYVPMQEDEKKWQEKLEKYNFNVIFFHKNDLTPWAQAFLIKRISDPDWAPVYVDNYVIMFLKRNEINQPIIKKYELPKDMFRVS